MGTIISAWRAFAGPDTQPHELIHDLQRSTAEIENATHDLRQTTDAFKEMVKGMRGPRSRKKVGS